MLSATHIRIYVRFFGQIRVLLTMLSFTNSMRCPEGRVSGSFAHYILCSFERLCSPLRSARASLGLPRLEDACTLCGWDSSRDQSNRAKMVEPVYPKAGKDPSIFVGFYWRMALTIWWPLVCQFDLMETWCHLGQQTTHSLPTQLMIFSWTERNKYRRREGKRERWREIWQSR